MNCNLFVFELLVKRVAISVLEYTALEYNSSINQTSQLLNADMLK